MADEDRAADEEPQCTPDSAAGDSGAGKIRSDAEQNCTGDEASSEDEACDDIPEMPRIGDEVLVSLRARAADGSCMLDKPPMAYRLGSNDLGPISFECQELLQNMKVGDEANVMMGGQVAPTDGSSLVLTLDRIYHTVDLSYAKDMSIVKKRKKAGRGEPPRFNANIKLAVESVTDGFKFLPGFEPEILEFACGNGEVCDVLELAVTAMKQGEKAILKIAAADRDRALEPRLGLSEISASQIEFKVILLAFEDAVNPYLMNLEHVLTSASAQKETGTKLFKAGRFELASKCYHGAFELLDAFAEELDNQASDLRKACQMNMAASFLKLKDYTAAFDAGDAILKLEPENIKALYRRAQASLGLENFAQCIADCKSVVALDNNNLDARNLLKQARESHQRSKGLFGGISAA